MIIFFGLHINKYMTGVLNACVATSLKSELKMLNLRCWLRCRAKLRVCEFLFLKHNQCFQMISIHDIHSFRFIKTCEFPIWSENMFSFQKSNKSVNYWSNSVPQRLWRFSCLQISSCVRISWQFLILGCKGSKIQKFENMG